MKCLEKRVDDRFQTVADLAATLAPFASLTSVALATQRMSGALGSSSSGSRPAVPPDRPSFRAAGGSTDVAWDQTQLATTGTRRTKVVPIVVAVALASTILGAAVVVGVLHKRSSNVQASPNVTTTAAPPLPTVRDPISPPVVSGVERPPPSSVIPVASHAARPEPTHHVASPPRDAGAHSHPSSGEGDLPSTRN